MAVFGLKMATSNHFPPPKKKTSTYGICDGFFASREFLRPDLQVGIMPKHWYHEGVTNRSLYRKNEGRFLHPTLVPTFFGNSQISLSSAVLFSKLFSNKSDDDSTPPFCGQDLGIAPSFFEP